MSLPSTTSFTLDTNFLIEVEEGRAEAANVKGLLQEHTAGRADLALVASCASERQLEGGFLDDLAVFSERCRRLGFGGA